MIEIPEEVITEPLEEVEEIEIEEVTVPKYVYPYPENVYNEIEDLSSSSLLAFTTSYYGHIVPSVPVKVRYISKSTKRHEILVSFIKRSFDTNTNLVYEYVYTTVKAWVGDNNTVHLMQPLPGETEVKLNFKDMFSVTPEQEDIDEDTRARIIGDLFESAQDTTDF